MKRLWIPILILTVLCLLSSGTGAAETAAPEEETQGMTEGMTEAEEAARPGLLRIATGDMFSTMDIHRTTEDYMVPLNIYERLFDIRLEDDGTTVLVNALAEDYSVSEDGLVYSFTLRDDAFFADGTKVTASDVAFSFSRMLSLPGSVQKDFADMIQGAGKVMSGEADTPEGIEVLDGRHLQITLSEPFSGYIYQLASPSCSILSETFVTKAGDGYGTSADLTMGSGAYMVTELTPRHIFLKKNPYYHCYRWESLSVEEAEIRVLPPALLARAFEEGSLDILDTDLINPDAVERICGSDHWSSQMTAISHVEIKYLMMNLKKFPLNDVRIRKAVQMAVDRQGILDQLYDGRGRLIDGIYPEGLIGYNEENQGWLKYDPEGAKKLVSEVPGASQVHLELAANSQSSTRSLTMLEMIRHDLKEAGLKVSIVSYDEESMMYLRKKGKLMAYTGEWGADFDDPDNFIYTFFGSTDKTYSRSSNYADQTVIRRIQKARTLQDMEERLAEYAALEDRLVREDAVWVPLFSTEHLFVLGDRVEAFTPFWAGWSSMYFHDIVLKRS